MWKPITISGTAQSAACFTRNESLVRAPARVIMTLMGDTRVRTLLTWHCGRHGKLAGKLAVHARLLHMFMHMVMHMGTTMPAVGTQRAMQRHLLQGLPSDEWA